MQLLSLPDELVRKIVNEFIDLLETLVRLQSCGGVVFAKSTDRFSGDRKTSR